MTTEQLLALGELAKVLRWDRRLLAAKIKIGLHRPIDDETAAVARLLRSFKGASDDVIERMASDLELLPQMQAEGRQE